MSEISGSDTPGAADASRSCPPAEAAQPSDTPEEARARRLLWNLGYFGHYLHFHSGGRSGRAAIICLIAKNDGQMSQQELGAYFDLKPGSLSEILAKIENAGLIERTRNPEDRRQLSIRLTEKGEQEAAREQEARVRFRQRAFACLSDEQQEQLADTLDIVRKHWEELND
ncbi:MarR family transcriptional regulator [Collinsella tanakaei]|uniref:MarR family winged helix-turn-helix transcriptional regulator n=1 Tax=Collinsella tanakaei TaxID=626935 RepID=UPI00195D9582|nr:MarR family transcriptional regulator [Collinsella tanakaei]MBM6778305.1 MarR family transcriptional regulator [Collinsella tanakaei]